MFPPAPLRTAQRNRATSIGKKRGDGLERQPPASSPGGARPRCAQRSETTHRPVAARRPSPHIPHRAERHAGQGTPTSGQFSRWGPAPLRKAQRNGATPIGKKRGDGLERRPLASSPGGGRHRWPPASARRIAQWRRGAPLPTYPTGQSGTQARERRLPGSSPAGPRRHRPRRGRNAYAAPCKVRPSPNNGR